MSRTTPRQQFATIDEWRIAMAREFERRFDSGDNFSSEDVREYVGLPPGDAHHSTFGGEWRKLVHSYERSLRISGLKRSSVPASRGRLLPIYRKAD